MTETPSSLRRLANVLVSHAVRVMPPARRGWADAMAGEVSHVDNDRRALRWALGCVLAAHGERIRELHMMDLLIVRVAVALLILFKAFGAAFATAMTVAYKMNQLGVTESFGKMTPGDDYRRLIPLMEAVPAWLHALWVAAALCYLAAIVGLLTRQRLAYVAVVVGLGLELAGTLLERPIIEAVGVRANPNPSVLAQFLQFGLPLLVAVAAWYGSRPQAGRLAPTR